LRRVSLAVLALLLTLLLFSCACWKEVERARCDDGLQVTLTRCERLISPLGCRLPGGFHFEGINADARDLQVLAARLEGEGHDSWFTGRARELGNEAAELEIAARRHDEDYVRRASQAVIKAWAQLVEYRRCEGDGAEETTGE